jgi:hypothetical protein
MRIVESHSHLNGYEWLKVHEPKLIKEITAALANVDANRHRTKKSKEAKRKGKILFSPPAINAAIKKEFTRHQWGQETTSYWVTSDYKLIQRTMRLEAKEQKAEIESQGLQAIRSYNQTDFVKNRVAVEVQFGKYSFVAYDLFVKHLAFFVADNIDVGVEILPMKSMQVEMSSGPGYYEGALYDLARSGRGVPSVPIWLIGVDA